MNQPQLQATNGAVHPISYSKRIGRDMGGTCRADLKLRNRTDSEVRSSSSGQDGCVMVHAVHEVRAVPVEQLPA